MSLDPFQSDFQQFDLKAYMVAFLREFFKDRKVDGVELVKKVIPAYPSAKNAVLPCITVNYVSDNHEGKTIGLDMGSELTPSGEVKEYTGTYFRSGVEVRYITENYELRDSARPWIRAAFVAAMERFMQIGADLPQITGGADEQEQSESAPHDLYMLAYTVSYLAAVRATQVWYERSLGVDVGLTFGNPADPDSQALDGPERLMGAP